MVPGGARQPGQPLLRRGAISRDLLPRTASVSQHLHRISRRHLGTFQNLPLSQVLGLASPPPLEAKTVGKMGLKGVPGLTIGGGGGGHGGGGKGKGGGGGGGGKGKGKGFGGGGGKGRGAISKHHRGRS